MAKASELIKNECCGIGLLNIEKSELVAMVKTLEHKNESSKGKMKLLNDRNRKLTLARDLMFCFVIVFSLVIIYV